MREVFPRLRLCARDLDHASAALPLGQIDEGLDTFRDVVVLKPWGYEYVLFDTSSVALWVLSINMGHHTSFHAHTEKATTLVVLGGRVLVKTFEREFTLDPLQGVEIDKGVFHQTSCLSAGGATVLEIETPNLKSDLIRLKDAYGRSNMGYEGESSFRPRESSSPYIQADRVGMDWRSQIRIGDARLTLRRSSLSSAWCDLRESSRDALLTILEEPYGSGDSFAGFHLGQIVDATETSGYEIDNHQEFLLCTLEFADEFETGAQQIADALVSVGISRVFATLGDANSHLVRAFCDHASLDVQYHSSEDAAVHAGLGYAVVSDRPSCVLVGSGISGPHVVAGLASAWADSLPLVVVAGQTRTDQITHLHQRQVAAKSIPMEAVVAPLVKGFFRVEPNVDIVAGIGRAVEMCCSGRPGPLWIDVPLDVQTQRTSSHRSVPTSPSPRITATDPRTEDIDRVITMLQAAERPVLLGGAGIRGSEGRRLLAEVAESLHVPVQVTRTGMDRMSASHPMFVGRPGGYGQRGANFIIQNCDLLIAVGASLSLSMIGRDHASFARGAAKIAVDLDIFSGSPHVLADVTWIESDAVAFLRALLSRIRSLEMPMRTDWISQCRRWLSEFPPAGESDIQGIPNGMYQAIRMLSERLPERSVVAVDGGPILHIANQIFYVKGGQRIVAAGGLENRGSAVPAAVGIASSDVGGSCYALCDSVGFRASLDSLQVMRRESLAAKIIVMTAYDTAVPNRIDEITFPGVGGLMEAGNLDTSQVAALFSIPFVRVHAVSDWPSALDDLVAAQHGAILEIMVNPDQGLAPRPGYSRTTSGEWHPRPIEDMDPPLNRDVLRANMLMPLWED